MNSILKIEEALMFLLSVYLFSLLSFKWWLYPALILLPDIGMLGYIFNNRIGSVTYNIFHHKGLAIIIYFLGIYFPNETIQLIGIIIFGHSSLDRILGYGLKFPDSFKHTHLGVLN